ncbi:MAG: UDP-N-acetylmuramoyl-tripeptide--D-alanyl-D-alanine ligase, partial [Bacteroidota bacterium]
MIKQKQKKKFVFTARAIRLFSCASIFLALSFFTIIYFPSERNNYSLLLLIVLDLLLFAIILVAIIVVKPIELLINRWYYNDARRILKQMPDLLIIGITGSYGKTSTKFFLHKILSEKFNVLMTPESYNTTMGVIKTIREKLNPIHQVFIVEMGAKQIGDIKEICDLVHPQIGIITAVAEQHLETFKNIQNVQKTKFELANSLPQNGKIYLNADFEKIENYILNNNLEKYYYSTSKTNTSYYSSNLIYTNRGLKFDIYRLNEKLLDIRTKLLGKYNVSNILGCCAVAYDLGIDIDNIKFAVNNLHPVPHRLEIKTNSNGITIIDDAYNSNPNGAAMALEVLNVVEGRKKIIVTPGMVELGEKE